MKTLKQLFLLSMAALSLAACEKDEDKLYLSSPQAGSLIATEETVVLSQENNSDIVLSLAWTKDALQVSDPQLSAIDLTIQTLQVSLDEAFENVASESVQNSLSVAYTGSTLNALAKNIGATPDVANDMYFRLAAQSGRNMQPVYSNVVKVTVTPYTIDMSLAYILDSNKNETGATLASDLSDGHYQGFMGATSWYNYYLREGDGTVWGNDGVDGTAFLISSDESTMWNFWFPGLGGCYYVDVNTRTQQWSALYIASLSVSGDIQGNMVFDRPNVRWTLTFTAEQAGPVTVNIAGNGQLYDITTGTDGSDSEANTGISTPVAFAMNGESLIFGQSAGSITVDVPAAGENTLTIDLSNPKQWTISVAGGSVEPAEVSEWVYLPGISDGEGSWTFNNALRLYDEDKLGYAGCADVNSPWGYQVAIEQDNWADVYKMASGDATAGTLAFAEGENIPAPGTGLYFLQVSLKELTYATTPVGSEIYYSGFNDDWALHPMTATATPGVFTATVEVTGATPWGFQIVLDQNWSIKLGGEDGNLRYQGTSSVPNIAFDGAPGSYTLTVDLIHSTYTIE